MKRASLYLRQKATSRAECWISLQEAFFMHHLLNVIEFQRRGVREILNTVFCNHEGVFTSNVEFFFGNPDHGIYRYYQAWPEWFFPIFANVMYGHTDWMGQVAAEFKTLFCASPVMRL